MRKISRKRNPEFTYLDINKSDIKYDPTYYYKHRKELIKDNIFQIDDRIIVKKMKHGLAVASNRFYIYYQEQGSGDHIDLIIYPGEILNSLPIIVELIRHKVTEKFVNDRIKNVVPPIMVKVNH